MFFFHYIYKKIIKINIMYFIANLQPLLYGYDKNTGFLSINEKKKIIENFYINKNKGKGLSICEEHSNGSSPGFKLSKEDIIGNIDNIILNNKGELLVTGELFKDNHINSNIINEMKEKKQLYGVSLWLDMFKDKNTFKNKKLNHVAITKIPALGKEGSYIYEWSYSKEKIDNILKDKYYKYSDKNRYNYIQNNNNDKIDNIEDINKNFRYASNDLLKFWEKGFLF